LVRCRNVASVASFVLLVVLHDIQMKVIAGEVLAFFLPPHGSDGQQSFFVVHDEIYM